MSSDDATCLAFSSRSADPPDVASGSRSDPGIVPGSDASTRSSTSTVTRIPPASRVARLPPRSSAAIRPSQPPDRLRARSPRRQVRGTIGSGAGSTALSMTGSRPRSASARPTASSSAETVSDSRSSAWRVVLTSVRRSSTIRSASARAARTASSRSRRARRRSSSATRSCSMARTSARRARSRASLVSPSVVRIAASVASKVRCDSVNRERASTTIDSASPSRSAMANAWLPPGRPIDSR